MKKLVIIMALILKGATSDINAKLGCMDDSKYLSEKFDTKELHYVQCNCPCNHYYTTQPHNQCIYCLHYHAGPTWEIIKARPIQIKEPYLAPKMVLNPAKRNVKKILDTLATRMQLQGS